MQDLLAGRPMGPTGIAGVTAAGTPQLSKTGAKAGDDPERLKGAAREFEALFLSYMLGVMRETIGDAGLTEKGPGEGIYTELFDQEVARSLANRGALGISNLILGRMPNASPKAEPGKEAASPPSAPPVAGPKSGGSEEVPDFRMPVQARISSEFGLRKDPLDREVRMHKGIDIAAPAGMSVQAACAGRVISAGYEKGYGNTVVVQHPGGFETRYAHLGSIAVRAGDAMPENGVLGTVGSSGRSTGPHLHFEVIRHGERVDPHALLP
jgi:murein DD-endopeptidase MepM/ murein hydrolase activator NlpD